jgi:hypothetical protein
MVSRFIEFVRMHNRELILVLESVSSCSTYSEAQADFSLNDQFFCRARLRLKVLYRCFSTGNPVPQQPSSNKQNLSGVHRLCILTPAPVSRDRCEDPHQVARERLGRPRCAPSYALCPTTPDRFWTLHRYVVMNEPRSWVLQRRTKGVATPPNATCLVKTG